MTVIRRIFASPRRRAASSWSDSSTCVSSPRMRNDRPALVSGGTGRGQAGQNDWDGNHWSGYSGFDGDDRCILPPDPEDGIQLHVGPTDYTDQAQIDEFTLQPGEERTECYYLNNPSAQAINFFKQAYRMRRGSHHLIMHTMLGGSSTTPGCSPPCRRSARTRRRIATPSPTTTVCTASGTG